MGRIVPRMSRLVYIQTFGCQMNVYDSERILQVLRPLQYQPTDDVSRADLILLNTCTVRDKAEQKVLSALGRYAPLKQLNPELVLGVAGCVAQQEGANLLKKVPYLDLVFGPDNIRALPELLGTVRDSGQRVAETTLHKKKDGYEFLLADGLEHDGGPTAMVTVMKGCNKTCSYCIVPQVRGRELSKPWDQTVLEVERLVAAGAREVMLLGQNVNSYGHDREDGVKFPELLDRVAAVAGLKRLRFTTSHPWDCTDALVARFDGRLPVLCEYFHLPVQSGSDRVLAEMRRGYTAAEYLERAAALRQTCPGLFLTTDIIVGYPGETEADFEQTLALVRAARFDSLFGFKYSPRPGTIAGKLDDDVPDVEKGRRLDEVFRIANAFREERMARYLDQVVEVLVEGPSRLSRKEEPSAPSLGPLQLMGRTRTNLIVNFPVPHGAMNLARFVGELVPIHITRIYPHSLYGELVQVA